jgi:hypothetical protein
MIKSLSDAVERGLYDRYECVNIVEITDMGINLKHPISKNKSYRAKGDL